MQARIEELKSLREQLSSICGDSLRSDNTNVLDNSGYGPGLFAGSNEAVDSFSENDIADVHSALGIS